MLESSNKSSNFQKKSSFDTTKSKGARELGRFRIQHLGKKWKASTGKLRYICCAVLDKQPFIIQNLWPWQHTRPRIQCFFFQVGDKQLENYRVDCDSYCILLLFEIVAMCLFCRWLKAAFLFHLHYLAVHHMLGFKMTMGFLWILDKHFHSNSAEKNTFAALH